MEAPFDIAADLDTPVSAYLKLRDLQPRFLLESVEGGERLARYSFLGFGDALEVRMDSQGLIVNGEASPRPANQQQYLDALRAALAQAPRPGPEVDGLPFAGGLVGVSGYDVVRLFERLPQTTALQTNVPDAAFVAPASLLVFDHLTRRVALLHDGPETERRELRQEVIRCLRGATPNGNGEVAIGDAEASFTEAEFCERVDACKEYIASGDIYQIVISVLFRGRSNVPPFEVYRALRLLNPSPYMFFLEFGDLKVVGSSPEALVRLHGSTASLRPIAGTLPRGATPGEDRANEEALLADPKEAAHIVSGVKGELEPDKDQFDLFAASFPAGTLVGAPKVRAMEIIEEMEQVGRGLYAGTAGYFGLSGDMDQAITIRTLVFSGDEYSFQAGAGIVADSVPANEYREVLAKSAILRRALEIAGEGL
ncbi:MAG: anthranilate synthase component I family protein [Woeseiaceae bacterium]